MLLLQRDEQPAGKAIIVFSDGEVHQPDDANAAAQEAAADHIPVYTVGIGIEAAPIPVEGGFLEYRGQTVTSAPDPEMLKGIARATGGAYVTSVASGEDMANLVSELRRSLTSVVRDQQQRETWNSLFQYPLGLAAGLLLFSAWLGDGRRLAGVAVLLFALGAGAAQAGTLAEADQAYRDGNFREASRRLEELSLERPTDPDLLERLAAARYRLEDFEGASRAWDQAASLRNGDAGDEFNSANAHYQAGRLERARDMYDQILADHPDDAQAKQNKELVEQELVERRKVKPPPPPDQGGGKNQEQNPSDGQDQQQPAPAPADPQAGDPGDPQQGDPQGDPQPGEGDPQPGEQGTDPGQADAAGGQDPTGQDANQTAGGGTDGQPTSGPISAAQAERMLDAVEEGQPAYTYAGPPGGPPW
jgi:Ca-activated chloride channel family protein